MLRGLTLHNLALFENQEIQFRDNLNVILGETGAGKSLIFDAINFVLSFKTDRTLLRSGAETMRVEAVFEPVNSQVKNLLKDMEIEEEAELIISRTLYVDGRTTTRVNGTVCPQSFIKLLAPELVDTFLQHENLQILKAKNHIYMLDRFCAVDDLKKELRNLIDKKSVLMAKVKELGGSEKDRELKKDFLEFQIKELEQADLKIGEDEEIDSRLKLLQSAEQVSQNLGEAISLLDSSSSSAISHIDLASRLIGKLGDIKSLPELNDRIQSVSIELNDIVAEIKNILDDVDSDPLEIERLDQRRDKLRLLKKKYGGTIEQCIISLNNFKDEIDRLVDGEEITKRLLKEIEDIELKETELCDKIHNLREEAAQSLKLKLQSELSDLGMKSTQFEVKFDKKQISFDGYDDITFVFSANKGQDLKDLSKTASGGESSRIMLAIKNIFAFASDNKTLLFDEIDSGISGEIGNMMAQKLSSIARRDQVITITHLPQVASAGDNFIKVEKNVVNDSTVSIAKEIYGDEIIKEIAHIIGGENITPIMLENAKQLFERGQKFGR